MDLIQKVIPFAIRLEVFVMPLKLKKYKRTRHYLRDDPSVAITERRLLFNVSCYLKYLKDVKFLELYWDEENQVIGFKPVKESTEDSFPVRIYRQARSVITVVSAREFILNNRIMDVLKVRKTVRIEEDKGMLLARLKKSK